MERLDPPSPATLQTGLIKVASTESARKAAAAVLIMAMGDPGERRWKSSEDAILVKKSRKGWTCTYRHGDAYHVSEVGFDKKGMLTALHCNPPPVP